MPSHVRTLVIGAVGGFFGSMVGLGGAVVMIPLLTGWAQLTQHRAHATSLVAVVFTGIIGALSYSRGGALDLSLAVLIAAAATVTSVIAATYSERVPSGVLRRLFGALLVAAATVLLLGVDVAGDGIGGAWRVPAALLLGLFSGTLTGLLGIGGGAFIVPLLVLAFGLDQHLAQGTSLAVMVPAGVAGTFVHWRAKRLDGRLVLGLVVGVAVGAFVGGQAALSLPERPLQVIFGVILLWTGWRYLRPAKKNKAVVTPKDPVDVKPRPVPRPEARAAEAAEAEVGLDGADAEEVSTAPAGAAVPVHHEAYDAANVSARGPFKEPVNAITHLLGALLAVAATVALLFVSDGSPRVVASLAIFGVSSVLLFSSSTLLHAVRAGPELERWLRRLDHAAIFVLIAGSYTPIALIAMQPDFAGWGWTLFGIVWGIALAGLVFKLLWIGAPRWLSTALYLAMGWLVVVAIVPVARSLGITNMTWLGLGGLFYTVGAIVYALKRPNLIPGVLGFHELWHVFVLAGWGSHLVIMFRIATAAA